jgi:N-acetylneuraminate synthase
MLELDNIGRPYLIAEIGINHNGDVQIAKRLIDAVFACGWDCVKFQKRTPALCVPEDQKGIMRDTPWGRMTYMDYRYRVEFEREQYDYIDRYCNEKPTAWTASAWDVPSVEFLNSYDVPFIKIPSAKLTDVELLLAACRTGKPVIQSTGMSTLEEIDAAVEILQKEASQFALLHTNSAYPAPIEELNVRVIQTLKDRYGCPVGYSGHEYDVEPTVYAVALGATIVERHITLSHDMWGTDQSSSLEVVGMDLLAKRVANVKAILGDGIKRVTESEIPARRKLRGE